MWTGGVRVIVLDEKNRILMVRHRHEERSLWMVPGGGIEPDEDSKQACAREVKEETGLDIDVGNLIWHVEEVGPRGQRFVNFFTARMKPGQVPKVGKDPEFDEEHQVLCDVRFMSREEVAKADAVYPEFLRDEFWRMMEIRKLEYDAFRMRDR